jgi:isoleucyl-tRNA synthetase
MAEKYNPIEVEKEIHEFWTKNNIYQNIKNKNHGKKRFYFLDGPPYTSGKVHLGTAWNKALKDMVLRYKRMKGLDVWDRAGYDMHGLPTEHATEKKLNLNGKEDIQKYGVSKFIDECKKLCVDNMNLMNEDFKKLGVWMDFENAYQSIKNDFIDGEWWLIKKAHEQQRLYRGLRTMTWCKDCATALAKHELEYQEVTDTSVFVKFKVKDTENEYLIIWTTTPWTIPFNMAVMVNPELDYVKAKVDDEVWILSKALGPMVIQAVVGKKYHELEEFKGEKLKGLKYEHFFDKDMNYSKIEAKNPENVHTVVLSEEYVDTSAGTGLVHCAPGCGPEDYEVGYKNGIPAFNIIDEKGMFPKESGKFAGLVAKKDDAKFIEMIAGENALVATSDVEHDYAHCWRCHNGVVYRTTKQWFFKVEDIKDQMIKENNDIKWVPNTAYNAFNSWLQNLRDNSISKQRYWGTPIPVWVNEKDEDDYIVVGSIKQLEELSNKKVEDPHIPKIDEIIIEKDGKKYKRIPDILDVWVDAGTVSWNCLDFPKNKELFDNLFPAEFILEGKDQIRGWFNLLHVASMISMNRPSFKNVYMHGFVQDSQGRKMSKSLGNYILPEEVINKHGADTFRYYFIGGANPGLDINYNPDDVELKNKNLHVLWNIHNFIIDFFKNNDLDYNSLKNIDTSKLDLEEKFMLSLLNSKIKMITESFEAYRLNEVPLLVEELYLSFSRRYIQLIRDKAVQGSDQDKNNIGFVLIESLMGILKMFSCVCPMITDKIYLNLKPLINTDQSSIHEFEWPQYDPSLINLELENNVIHIESVIQGILFAREKAQLGVRWPVKNIIIETTDKSVIKAINSLKSLIMSQTNIKNIDLKEKFNDVKISIKPDYGKIARIASENTQLLVAEIIKNQDKIIVDIETNSKSIVNIKENQYEIIKDYLVYEYSAPEHIQQAEFKAGMVYLDKTRTPELEAEGFSREITRRVQQTRKNAGLQRSDEIELFIKLPSELIDGISCHVNQIKTITGSIGIMIDSNDPDKEYLNISDEKIKNQSVKLMFNKL